MKLEEKASNSQNNPYQFYINNNTLNAKEYNFKKNKINTRKYNWITFIPHCLFLQFVRPANIYFLVTSIIQCIPQISPLSPVTAILPLVFVLSVSLIREAIEDYSRGKLDKKQNNEITMVYRDNKWNEIISGDLCIGELVLVKQDLTFPADLILIDSELNEGICYIETATLDGEKSLKLRESSKETAGKLNNKGEPKKEITIEGIVITDPPNQDLFLLSKIMKIKLDKSEKEQIISLNAKQLLLRGAKLKNTKWIIGIVVYVGHDCKIMKNSKNPVAKYSSLEKLMNFGLIFIFTLLIILSIIASILRGVYYHHNNLDEVDKNPSGFGYTEYKYGVESFLNFFTYVLLLSTLIPISLIITVEIVKLLQGLYMYVDASSYSHLRKKWLKPNSVSLNEECGLVNYIFSDKTGTLTCNKMEFKYCVIGDICYRYMDENPEENTKNEEDFLKQENIIPFENYDMYKAISGEYNKNNKLIGTYYNGFIIRNDRDPNLILNLESNKDLIENFWLALTLCNSCSVHINEKGEEEYISVSPDNIVLVKAAKNQGFHLTKSEIPSIKKILLGNKDDKIIEIELLHLIEFTSERKRESVIVKDKGIIKLFCKGADSIIKSRCSPYTNPQIVKHGEYYIDKFSKKGLRTLFISMKILSQEEYDIFAYEVKIASTSLENKEELLENIYDKIERNLYIIGATIVEDKLQENVPETIRDLSLADIKIWMLTGDKMDTAENIAKSCNLINDEIYLFRLCGKENSGYDNAINSITEFALKFREFKGRFDSLSEPGKFAIIINEKMLCKILPQDKDKNKNKSETGIKKITKKAKNFLKIMQNQQMTLESNTDINDGDEEKLFMSIAKHATSVICCRVSPSQKAKVVLMMKRFNPQAVTLAIGDGGNDVPMIMEANIGVGIYGEEGMRAVQSSDYAIGEFQYLRSLLLYHGRNNYIRNAELIIYFFYKNFCFTLVHFYFGFYCNFTGQTILDDWFISCFNLLFTSLPLGMRALLDLDISIHDGKIVDQMLPFLYAENKKNPVFTIPKFFFQLFIGIIHSIIIFFFCIYLFQYDSINSDGKMGGLWYINVNIYTNILIVVSVNLIINTKYETILNLILIVVFDIFAFIIFMIIAHRYFIFYSIGTISSAFGSSRFWMELIFVSGTCGLIDFFIHCFGFVYKPSMAKILQKLVNQRGKINDENNLPNIITDKLNKYKSYEQQKVHLETEKNKIPQNTEYLNINETKNNYNIYENNDKNNNQTNTYNTQENSEIVPYIQEPPLALNNNFNKDL